jgi:hypothetical protein
MAGVRIWIDRREKAAPSPCEHFGRWVFHHFHHAGRTKNHSMEAYPDLYAPSNRLCTMPSCCSNKCRSNDATEYGGIHLASGSRKVDYRRCCEDIKGRDQDGGSQGRDRVALDERCAFNPSRLQVYLYFSITSGRR